MDQLFARLAQILGKSTDDIEKMAVRRPLQVVLEVGDLDVGTRIQLARELKRFNDIRPVTERVVLSGLQTRERASAHH